MSKKELEYQDRIHLASSDEVINFSFKIQVYKKKTLKKFIKIIKRFDEWSYPLEAPSAFVGKCYQVNIRVKQSEFIKLISELKAVVDFE